MTNPSSFAEAIAMLDGTAPTTQVTAPVASNYATAYASYLAAVQEAVAFHDPNWTHNAITRERAKRVQAARAELAKALPARSEREASDNSTRDEALAQLAVTNADTAAVASNEWAKVKTMLDGGRNLAKLIEQSDRRRLMAIMDHLDTDLVADTNDIEGVTAEVTQAVVARLADLGDSKAQQALAAQTVGAHEQAWHRVIDEASRGEVSITARSALRHASVEQYDAAFPDTNEADSMREAISRLDQLGLTTEAANGDASA